MSCHQNLWLEVPLWNWYSLSMWYGDDDDNDHDDQDDDDDDDDDYDDDDDDDVMFVLRR